MKLIEKILWLFLGEEYVLLHKVRRGKYKSVCLYGANSLCARMICLLHQEGIEVSSVVDKRSTDVKVELQGLSAVQQVPSDSEVVVICVLNDQESVFNSLRETFKSISVELEAE